jgi:hypothetical protein
VNAVLIAPDRKCVKSLDKCSHVYERSAQEREEIATCSGATKYIRQRNDLRNSPSRVCPIIPVVLSHHVAVRESGREEIVTEASLYHSGCKLPTFGKTLPITVNSQARFK